MDVGTLDRVTGSLPISFAFDKASDVVVRAVGVRAREVRKEMTVEGGGKFRKGEKGRGVDVGRRRGEF